LHDELRLCGRLVEALVRHATRTRRYGRLSIATTIQTLLALVVVTLGLLALEPHVPVHPQGLRGHTLAAAGRSDLSDALRTHLEDPDTIVVRQFQFQD
jgi:hypothetical protein